MTLYLLSKFFPHPCGLSDLLNRLKAAGVFAKSCDRFKHGSKILKLYLSYFLHLLCKNDSFDLYSN